MRFNFRNIFMFIGLFLLALILSTFSQLELPASSGPYAVGRMIFEWKDTSRLEVLTEDPNDVREVVALVWYPVQAGTGVKAGYFSNLDLLSEALRQSGEVEWWQVVGLRFIRSESRFSAAPIKAERPFPVVVLSPGNGTNVEFYASLASGFASHGYIVVGLNHPYDVAAVELSTGAIAPYDRHQWSLSPAAHQAYIRERIKVRTADVLYVLEQLNHLNSTGQFAGLMDLDSVAAVGHSLGGITAAEACKADPRFRACMNLDGLQKGGPFSMDEAAIPPQQPFMFLTKESQLHPTLLERFEAMPESYWIVVHGASHQGFTDGPLLQPSLLPGPNRADQLMTLIQKYSIAFLDRTLKRRADTLLSKSVEQEDVSVRVFPSN